MAMSKSQQKYQLDNERLERMAREILVIDLETRDVVGEEELRNSDNAAKILDDGWAVYSGTREEITPTPVGVTTIRFAVLCFIANHPTAEISSSDIAENIDEINEYRARVKQEPLTEKQAKECMYELWQKNSVARRRNSYKHKNGQFVYRITSKGVEDLKMTFKENGLFIDVLPY